MGEGRTWLTGKSWRQQRVWRCVLGPLLALVLLNGVLLLLWSFMTTRCGGLSTEQPSCWYQTRNIRPGGLGEIHEVDLTGEPQQDLPVFSGQVARASTSPRHISLSDDEAANKTSLQYHVIMRSDMNSTRHLWPWGRVYGCDALSYDTSSLASVSVVITFHDNEQLSDLLHTVRSVLQRTSPHLLAEVILVDDNSQKVELREGLDRHLAVEFPANVRLLRSATRGGLIRARLLGTRAAQAPVIVCMDSHMEVEERWLEPLLEAIRQNRRTLAASYLDWMEEKDGIWEFMHGASTWKTYFDWSFTFGFQDMSVRDKQNRNETHPVRTPITIGGMFAIEKQFFREIGEFDDGMQFWGGENIDLALRVWLFGGRVVNVPCSHAAHLERTGHRNYRVGRLEHTWVNHKRVAAVWLGDYIKYFYYYNPRSKVLDTGDLSRRIALRRKSVRDFSWFLKNVFPEMGVPDVDTFAWGGVS
ncbi:hypothetical protein NP493_17g06021 [Ridgeia piscesae]|uniref:Glycosyltransferase 2-like domain-containing protein n=1 Tax=Ridgeia piscesae TaxID=27915 RepID=A0AAD9UKY9_RIDPI|nr:hypothetical protein NP493_17g06021 [Ridgeia piscesae]